ncbi:hypothetical protein CEP52_007154 [Fusarium oligoseptatum]|uniref:BZIP domain-containing protein n=1 Tax=Fusarium oligoseptatum TaxID=2604345 RepID=A0A428TP07_9HYPO|nr:hypothetical protein CEP52_007154 [Fusarium oligoseptatum]
MDTLVYFTDDGLQALPFGLLWSGSPPSKSIDTQSHPHPTDNISASALMGSDSPQIAFQKSPTVTQHPHDMSQQLINEADDQQSAVPKRKAVDLRNTPEVGRKMRRGRQSKAGEKGEAQYQEKGRHKTRKQQSTTTESRIRQQNKEAAIRCRRRKCQEEADLWSREKSLEDANRRLVSHCNYLKEEIYYIKEQLLQHSSCNCVLIQEYIANEAKKSVGKLSSPHSSGLSYPSSLGATSPSETGQIGFRDSSTEMATSSPADLNSPENADALLFQPLCLCYICRGATAEVSVEQAFNEVPLGNWEGSLDPSTMEWLDGDEAPWINT